MERIPNGRYTKEFRQKAVKMAMVLRFKGKWTDDGLEQETVLDYN
jgi:hypothetical protein